jgi:mannan endo-1,4-beta-mannosidase
LSAALTGAVGRGAEMKSGLAAGLVCFLGAACFNGEIGTVSQTSGGGDATGGGSLAGSGGSSGSSSGTGGGSGNASPDGGSGETGGAGSRGQGGSGGASNTGGAVNTGGAPNTGGSANTGGASNTGGSANTGGTRDGGRGTGGAPGTGGTGTTTDGGATTHATFYVDGRALRDPCGAEVILRGVNKMLVYADRSCASCAEIAKTGANSIRMMWFTAVALTEAETAVNNAVNAGLIPILEMHDATCDTLGAAVDPVIDFWVRPASVSFIAGHQSHLIVNIANEAGSNESAATFRTYYAGAVQRMRTAGIHVPLMIDANNCGRNGELLLSVAQGLLSDDPDHNLLFSMHWYDSGTSQTARVTTVMETAVSQNVSFLIGEFSSTGVPQCTPTVPYKQIISEAQRLGIGYLPWEWGPGNEDCKPASGNSPMDMTTGSTFATLQTGWATEVTMTDPASIHNTAVRTPFVSGGACQ